MGISNVIRNRLSVVLLIGCLSLLGAAAVPAHIRSSTQRQIKATVLAYGEAYLEGNYGNVCRLIRIHSAQARAALRAARSCIRFVELAIDHSKVMQYEISALPYCVKHSHLSLRERMATLRCTTGSVTPSPLTLQFHLRLRSVFPCSRADRDAGLGEERIELELIRPRAAREDHQPSADNLRRCGARGVARWRIIL